MAETKIYIFADTAKCTKESQSHAYDFCNDLLYRVV